MALRESIGRWEPLVDRALQFDSWGQVVEATELYVQMRSQAQELLRSGNLSHDQRPNVAKFLAIVEQRLANLRSAGDAGMPRRPAQQNVGLDYHTMEKVRDIRKYLLGQEPWPIQVSAHQVDTEVAPGVDDDSGDDTVAHDNRGYLLQAPQLQPGQRRLKLHIHSIGLKDAMDYLDPFIVVSVRKGPHPSQLVEPDQPTPTPKLKREPQAVVFEQTVFIMTPLDDLPQSANIFFEFKHFKPKKDKQSVRCWSMLSHDEYTVEGKKLIEIYAKPADYTARKFHKHSNKQLYLTLTVSILSNDGS